MSTSTKRMLIWGVLYLFMLLTLITPLSLITIHLMMIPLVLLFVILDLKRFILLNAAIVVILIVFLGSGGFFLMLLSMFFLIPSIAMGIQYRKGAESVTAVTTGIITLIAAMVLLLLFSSALGANMNDELTESLKANPNFMAMLNSILQSEDQIDPFFEMLISVIPVMIIMIATYYTMITHWLGRKLLTRLWKPVPKLKRMQEWMLPKSMVWYYLIVLVLDFVLVFDTGSVVSVIVINSLFLLTYAFALQAVGFLFFVTDIKGWHRALPIVALILMLIIPSLSSLLAWIGVIDVAFALRKWVKGKVNQNS